MEPIHVYVNPESGPGSNLLLPEFLEHLHRRGIITVVHQVSPAHLEQTINNELAEMPADAQPIFAICGGDGTMSTAANVLIDSRAILLPVPFGTRNHFSRRLGINDIEEAAEAVRLGVTLDVPVGSINEQVFVNNTSFGLYPLTVRYRDRIRQYAPKWLAAAFGGFAALIRRPRLDLRINLGERNIEQITSMLWIGVGRDSFQLPQFSDLDNTSDVLQVVVAKAKTRLGLVALGIKLVYKMLFNRRLHDDRSLDMLYIEHIVMRAQKRIDVAWDGEVGRFEPPLEISLRKNALHVIAYVKPEAAAQTS